MDEFLQKLRHVQAYGEAKNYLIDDMGLWQLMLQCCTIYCEQYYLNPHLAIKTLLDLLAILQQNPNTKVAELISGIS